MCRLRSADLGNGWNGDAPDQASYRPSQTWDNAISLELEKELNAAEVLLVFWTRHAARSEWVRHECETFDARFPERPLVPVVGDQTPLIKTLKSHQISDFCPLINELFAMVRDLDDQGISKREIRGVFKRLEEEGIHLPPEKRNRLFGLFGIVGLLMVPLYFLEQQRDVLMEMASRLPSATFYAAGCAAGAAAVAGYMTCHSLGGGGDTAHGGDRPPAAAGPCGTGTGKGGWGTCR